MTNQNSKEELVRFGLRLPQAMKDSLEASAKDNNQSLNIEIIERLMAFETLPSDIKSSLLLTAQKAKQTSNSELIRLIEESEFRSGRHLYQINEAKRFTVGSIDIQWEKVIEEVTRKLNNAIWLGLETVVVLRNIDNYSKNISNRVVETLIEAGYDVKVFNAKVVVSIHFIENNKACKGGIYA